jgi:hypothetical protein
MAELSWSARIHHFVSALLQDVRGTIPGAERACTQDPRAPQNAHGANQEGGAEAVGAPPRWLPTRVGPRRAKGYTSGTAAILLGVRVTQQKVNMVQPGAQRTDCAHEKRRAAPSRSGGSQTIQRPVDEAHGEADCAREGLQCREAPRRVICSASQIGNPRRRPLVKRRGLGERD